MKLIAKYISQKTVGYLDDFSKIVLKCKVLYTDGTIEIITETRPTTRCTRPMKLAREL